VRQSLVTPSSIHPCRTHLGNITVYASCHLFQTHALSISLALQVTGMDLDTKQSSMLIVLKYLGKDGIVFIVIIIIVIIIIMRTLAVVMCRRVCAVLRLYFVDFALDYCCEL
jgi:hypothetical protein